MTFIATETAKGVLFSKQRAHWSDYNSAAPGRFDINRLADLPDEAMDEFRRLARVFVDPKELEKAAPLLKSGVASERWAAVLAMEELVLKSLRARKAGHAADEVLAAVDEVGLQGLLLHPEFAFRWRQHLVATQPGSGRLRKSFVEFVSTRDNADLMARVRLVIGDARFARYLPGVPGKKVTFRSWGWKSSPAQRDAAVSALNAARKELGDEAFFAVLFGKAGHLIPPNAERKLRDEIIGVLGSGKAPNGVLQRNADQAFDSVDPGHLQSGFGEVLAAAALSKRGKALAEAEGGPVYMLLGTRMRAERESLSEAARDELARQPRSLPSGKDLPPDVRALIGQAEAQAEKKVPASSGSVSGEAADAWLVTVDAEKRMKDRVWAETKTSNDPAAQALDQFDYNFEGVDIITSRQFESVVRIDADGIKLLSPTEAAKELGGTAMTVERRIGGVSVKKDVTEVSEAPGFVAELQAARSKHDKAGGIGTGDDELALMKGRRFQNMRGAERLAYMGKTQKAKVTSANTPRRKSLMAEAGTRKVSFESYGDEYESLRDLAMELLAFASFSR